MCLRSPRFLQLTRWPLERPPFSSRERRSVNLLRMAHGKLACLGLGRSQPAGSFCSAGGSWEPSADKEALLCLTLLCLPVNPHPVFCLCLSPAQFLGDYLSSTSHAGIGKSQQPHPSQQPNELPKAQTSQARPSLHHGSGPCRNWEGMCLLGPCPVLAETGLRASPPPSPTDTQGFIVRLCHGNYAHGLPRSHGLSRKNNRAFSLCQDPQY